MIAILVASLVIVALAVLMLSVKVILKKNGKFSSQHVHDNKALREQGIDCVVEQDRQARRNNKAM